MASFALSGIAQNPAGWGPSPLVPLQYASLPFASFSRGERFGKCAIFSDYARANRMGARYGFGHGVENTELSYRYDREEAAEYTQVEGTRKVAAGAGGQGGGARGAYQRAARNAGAGGQGGGNRGNPRNARGDPRSGPSSGARGGQFGRDGPSGQGGRFGGGNKTGGFGSQGGINSTTMVQPREPSVKPEEDWIELETVELNQISKLSLPTSAIPEGKDIKWAGTLEPYDDDYDRITTKTAKKLKKFDEKDFPVEFKLSDDEIIRGIAAEDSGANVFTTDTVLSQIMAATRSVYPWDVVITYIPKKEGDKDAVLIHARNPLEFDLHTVNETSAYPPPENDPDNINGRTQLQIEASLVHQYFTQMSLMPTGKSGPAVEKERVPLAGEPQMDPAPFFDPEAAEPGRSPASMAFRYRKWNLPGDVQLVCRTTVHAVNRKKGGKIPQYVSVYSVNDVDTKPAGAPDWRKTIDTQRGNVVATEMKNNAMKLAKFTIQSLLAGVDSMKLGFIARQAKGDADNHVVLGVQSVVPATFANQLALNQSNMWAILKWVVDAAMKHGRNLQEEGEEGEIVKFVLLRDPVKAQLRLFCVPIDSFQEEEEGEDEAAE